MLDLFRQDAARYVRQGKVVPAESVTLGVILRLLYLHLPLRAIFWFRLGSWLKQKGVRALPYLIQQMICTRYGLEIVIGSQIGGGLYIAHPVGTVISANRIGKNCSIIAAVTIGMRNEWRFPKIGDNVFIGAGARVLGGITLGDGAVVGANAVVIDDVPAGATAVGIPARVRRSRGAEAAPAPAEALELLAHSPVEQTL